MKRGVIVFALTAILAGCGNSITAPADVPCNYRDACIRWTIPDSIPDDTQRPLYESQRQGGYNR